MLWSVTATGAPSGRCRGLPNGETPTAAGSKLPKLIAASVLPGASGGDLCCCVAVLADPLFFPIVAEGKGGGEGGERICARRVCASAARLQPQPKHHHHLPPSAPRGNDMLVRNALRMLRTAPVAARAAARLRSGALPGPLATRHTHSVQPTASPTHLPSRPRPLGRSAVHRHCQQHRRCARHDPWSTGRRKRCVCGGRAGRRRARRCLRLGVRWF